MEEIFICAVCKKSLGENEVAGKVHVNGKVDYYCKEDWNEWED